MVLVLLVPSFARYSYVRYLGLDEDGVGEEGVFWLGRFWETAEGDGATVKV